MTSSWKAIIICVVCLPQIHAQTGQNCAEGRNGMVSSASREASLVGMNVLKSGGNAVDAAVAVGFALSVTYPSAGNLGGGTYLVIRMADGREAAIDARETAPLAAYRDMYLDKESKPVKDKSLYGPIAAGVPGSVDGFLKALELYGTMGRTEVITPALRLARSGFRVPKSLAQFLRNQAPYFSRFPSSEKVFSRNREPWKEGMLWRQPDLAATLERILRLGRKGFYEGRTADYIIRQMRTGNGIITHDDLKQYTSIVRKPLHGTYRGFEIVSMPPSSSGGIALLELLNIIEGYDLRKLGHDSPEAAHIIIEAMRRVYADRSVHLGDPEFWKVPIEWLCSKEHASDLRKSITPLKATASSSVLSSSDTSHEGKETTHYSVVDKWGNAVSVTTTLNSVCGGKCVVDGTGFLLNNEMDDFSIKPGTPNQFGLVGNEANSIQPRKRMLSSMTPAIVLQNDTVFLVLGSPGGATIITSVLHVILNVVDHGMTLPVAVAAKRFHHQWMPDSTFHEQGSLTNVQLASLQGYGHSFQPIPALGRIDAVLYDRAKKILYGVSDARGHGAAIGY